MNQKRYLYLMISKTDTGMGRMIRFFSHYPYNHVSLSLDPSFRHWVSFARFRQGVPLYGGFVNESSERYLARGFDPQVRIFRLAIPEEKFRRLQTLCAQADHPDCGLIYNSFDAVASMFHRTAPIPGAYTCLGFVRAVLGKHYLSIQALNDDLQPYLIYDGPLRSLVSDSGQRSDFFFLPLNPLAGTWQSVLQLADLSTRPFRRGPLDPVAREFY